jgi:hypothetical protein
MASPVLYSTNVYLKQVIQREYRGDKHYVWCSEYFDAVRAGGSYTASSLIPPSSNPADIYRELKADCDRRDLHSSRIAVQKNSLTQRAREWYKKSEITAEQRDEILLLVKRATYAEWRPLIYVIPRDAVRPRLQLVPLAQRAGLGPEYIITDLDRSEFDLIEV